MNMWQALALRWRSSWAWRKPRQESEQGPLYVVDREPGEDACKLARRVLALLSTGAQVSIVHTEAVRPILLELISLGLIDLPRVKVISEEEAERLEFMKHRAWKKPHPESDGDDVGVDEREAIVDRPASNKQGTAQVCSLGQVRRCARQLEENLLQEILDFEAATGLTDRKSVV